MHIIPVVNSDVPLCVVNPVTMAAQFLPIAINMRMVHPVNMHTLVQCASCLISRQSVSYALSITIPQLMGISFHSRVDIFIILMQGSYVFIVAICWIPLMLMFKAMRMVVASIVRVCVVSAAMEDCVV